MLKTSNISTLEANISKYYLSNIINDNLYRQFDEFIVILNSCYIFRNHNIET